jgi:dihydrofolate reductase
MSVPLIIVVAVAENGVIGRDNQHLWRLKSDLRRFRDLTWGKPMIMGRKTYESIGRPLPGRQTIVLTRDPEFSDEGVHVAHSWEEAEAKGRDLAKTMDADAVAVAGGAEIYALALTVAERIYLTRVHASPEGDATFPAFDGKAFRELRRTEHPKGPDDEFPFTFIDLQRRAEAANR